MVDEVVPHKSCAFEDLISTDVCLQRVRRCDLEGGNTSLQVGFEVSRLTPKLVLLLACGWKCELSDVAPVPCLPTAMLPAVILMDFQSSGIFLL